jgi:lysophospholipase L1-like esterase
MVAPAPVLLVQGRRLRRETPRLPDAALPWSGSGSVDGARSLRLLVLGDSTAAGVGAETQHDALPGHLAQQLAARLGRGVEWRAVGENGATSRDLLRRYLAEATSAPADLVFLTVGANDALKLRPRWAFARDIRALLSGLRRANPDAVILVSSLPAFFRFELLPNPLRWNLYLHSRSLEDGARSTVARFAGAHMSPPPPPYTEGFFASDRFHPSASGYRDWARFAIEDAAAAGALTALESR